MLGALILSPALAAVLFASHAAIAPPPSKEMELSESVVSG
jgi:hypothetical protein